MGAGGGDACHFSTRIKVKVKWARLCPSWWSTTGSADPAEQTAVWHLQGPIDPGLHSEENSDKWSDPTPQDKQPGRAF